MDAVTTLGALMGLAFVSGLRLYSTIVAVGLGIRSGYLVVPADLSHLHVLAQTPVLVIAGGIYTIEFLADKIPWFDTAWDAVHTFIRPIGAAMLAATAIGDADPVVKLGAALLSGGVALSSHSAKAGTRVLANHSPEPFSNIGLSLAEDVIVAGGVWLALNHPLLTLAIVVAVVAFIVWLIPKLFRLFRRQALRISDIVRTRFSKAATPSRTAE